MSKFEFKEASREKLKLKMALAGVAGGGKTYTALRVARNLVGPDGKIAVIDTERGSAKFYAPKPGEAADESKGTFKFHHLDLENCHPDDVCEAIKAAKAGGFDVVILDSLSAAWNGRGGVLEEVEKIGARMGSKFNAWGPAGKLQNKLVDTILAEDIHVIATLREKMEYVQEKDEKNRTVVRKVGLKAVQRDDTEYEFTLYASMDQDNNLIVRKTRCSPLNPDQKHGGIFNKPGPEIAKILREWLDAGGDPEPKAPPTDWQALKTQALSDLQAIESLDLLKAFREHLPNTFPAGSAPDDVRKEIGAALTKRARELQATG
jgi:hypothetical protein